jgi:hypothetical protein
MRTFLAVIPVLALAACGADPADLDGRYEVVDGSSPTADAPAAAPGAEASAPAAKTAWYAGPKADGRVLAGFTGGTIGRWEAPGEEPGRPSGVAMCQQVAAGTHTCDYNELLAADARGDFDGAPIDATLYVDRTTPVEVRGVTVGVSHVTTCDGYHYPTSDRQWGEYAVVEGGPEGSRTMSYVLSPSVDYDEACLADASTCAKYVPTGMECNVERQIACCY